LKKINRFISVINKKEGASCITTHLHTKFSDVLQVQEDCKVYHRVYYLDDNLPFLQIPELPTEAFEIFS